MANPVTDSVCSSSALIQRSWRMSWLGSIASSLSVWRTRCSRALTSTASTGLDEGRGNVSRPKHLIRCQRALVRAKEP